MTDPAAPTVAEVRFAYTVAGILACRQWDWRSILGIARNVENPNVANSYRKLNMLIHPDKRTKLGIELAGGIDKSDRALHMAQEAYRDAVRWSSVKSSSPALSSPTPAPTCPTRHGPTPTESGPASPSPSITPPKPKASPPTLSQARELRLRQEMLLRRELGKKARVNPKLRLRRFQTKKKSTYGVSLGKGKRGW